MKPIEFPVMNVRMLPLDKLEANDYNPNRMAAPELKLLFLNRPALHNPLLQGKKFLNHPFSLMPVSQPSATFTKSSMVSTAICARGTISIWTRFP